MGPNLRKLCMGSIDFVAFARCIHHYVTEQVYYHAEVNLGHFFVHEIHVRHALATLSHAVLARTAGTFHLEKLSRN